MSRTDKTKPVWVQEREGIPWSRMTFNNGGGLKFGRRTYWGAERTAERNALRSGRTPEPSRPRHSVRWDFF